MRNIIRLAFIASIVVGLAAYPDVSYAQSRSGSSSSQRSSSSSAGRSSSHSSGSYSSGRSTSSRSSGSSTRSSYSSSSRGSSSPQRSSGSVSRGSSSSQRSSVSRGSQTTQRSNGSVSRGSSSSQRNSSSVSRGSQTPQRSSGSVSRGSSSQRSNGSVSRASSSSRNTVSSSRNTTPGRPAASVNGRPGGSSRSRTSAGRTVAQPRAGVRPVERISGAPRVSPHDRGFIDVRHHAPAHFYNHGPHYYGYHVHVLPPHYHSHWCWGHEYFICDGLYYRRWHDHYYICRPPYGIFFDRALYNLELTACHIAYYNTVYRMYDAINDNNRTIQEQNEVIARNNATIAQQNSTIVQNDAMGNESYSLAQSLGLIQSYADANMKYYYDDGIFFTEGKDGQFVTIVPPAGAIITELPDDYETVTLNGTVYYQIDDTILRMVINNGKACFEVLGQLPS